MKLTNQSPSQKLKENELLILKNHYLFMNLLIDLQVDDITFFDFYFQKEKLSQTLIKFSDLSEYSDAYRPF